ncbi:MAG: PQQ-binding-like beta-propeller repeat protein, partial [Planctomycetota bacterium]
GYSGPAVAGGVVVVLDRLASEAEGEVIQEDKPPLNGNFVRKRIAGKERVLGLRESDGEILWEHAYECDYTSASAYAIGPRATATIDGDWVYAFGAEGMLTCLRLADGKLVWQRDLKSEYDLKIPVWGMSCSPLIDGDRLVCIIGGEGTTCVALNKQTGKEVWRSLTAPEPGYCSPVIYTFDGKRQLIVWDSHHIHALAPDTGKQIWEVPFESAFAMSIAVPRKQDNFLFAMCFNRRCLLIKVVNDGNDVEVVWDGQAKTGIAGVHNTPLLIDDYIYGCGHDGLYTCARLSDGERVWTTFAPSHSAGEIKKRGDRLRPIGWGNVFTVQQKDRFFLANDHGELIIAKMSPEGYEEIDRTQLIEPTHSVGGRTLVWSHPAFANRSIYLRNDKEIRCYDLSQK